MNYSITPSLKHMVLVKIATLTWNQDEIRDVVAAFDFPLLCCERREKWLAIEYKVQGIVHKCPLPETLKEEILGFIKPIRQQILVWMISHEELLSGGYVKRSLSSLCWTPQGTVDNKKTAEALIQDENLEISKRYQLACIYCIECGVTKLWNSMPKRKKARFYSERHLSFYKEHQLVVLWTYEIKGEVAKLNDLIKKTKGKEISRYQFAFEYAAKSANKAATEYFLQKLTPSEREESLLSNARYVAGNRGPFPNEHFADVLCFLLSQMSEEQQAKVFERYPYRVLECFLKWPWQSVFLETANRTWDFLYEKDYSNLLSIIADKLKNGSNDYDYQLLFEEFWLKSSEIHKEYVILDEWAIGSLLSKLFKIKRKKNLLLILKYATLAQKETIIFNFKGMDICQELAYDNEWDLLKIFINECVPSQEKMIKFKKEFRKRCSKEKLEKEKCTWIKFFQLMDEFIQKDVKNRCMEEKYNSPAKRMRKSISEKV